MNNYFRRGEPIADRRSAGVTTGYVYDGDGNRVKKTVGSTTTYYVGNWHDVTGGTATKYC